MEYAQSVFDTCMKHGRFKDLEVYNILLQGWAERVSICIFQENIIKLVQQYLYSDQYPCKCRIK